MLDWLAKQLLSGVGLGSIHPSKQQELLKALTSGYDVGGTTQAGGAAIRIESMLPYLSVLTEQARHIVFWNMVSKPTAYSTAVEYARRTALGPEYDQGFYGEGELPETEDETLDRLVALVKFQGVTKERTMVADLVRSIVNPQQEVTDTGTMSMLRRAEQALFMGNAKLGLNGAEGVEPDGIETYITRDGAAANQINCWGDPLTEQHVSDAAQVVRGAFGFADKVLVPHPVWEDYAKEYLPNFQHRPGDLKGGALNVGFVISQIEATTGPMSFHGIHLYNGLTMVTPNTQSSSKAPTPNPTVVPTSVATGTGSWGSSLGAAGGSVEYQVSLANRFGRQTPFVSAPASLAIGAGALTNSARITITNPAGGYSGYPPTHVVIYRRDTIGTAVSPWGCVARVPLTTVTAGAASLIWDDDGEDMPGTYRCWVMDLKPEVFTAPQLLPFSKIELPLLTLSNRFALVQFWCTQSSIPNRMVMIKNIGRRTA